MVMKEENNLRSFERSELERNVYNDQLTEGFSQCSLIDSIEHSFVIYLYGLSTD